MAVTILFTVALIFASVNAGFVWQDDDDVGKKHDFRLHRPHFPTFPQLNFPSFPAFPAFPTFRPIVIPSPDDIAKKTGPNFNGISVSSSSSSTVDKDGKVVQTGGTTVVTNKGGVVKKFEFGDDPENVKIVTPPPILIPQIPILQPIIPILPLNPSLLQSFKPSNNQHFFGTSSVSYSEASDINGVKTKAGGTKIVSNVDGDVSEKSAHFGEHDAPTSHEAGKVHVDKKQSENEV